ncbi:uncharacterized protein LOC135814984 [Sycon ciliatum]|uniref:uncharacterized protein LOC135814984 n=1 Tax=Sycon ciliatum TaxID=27933 RepID=UPI0031F70E8B
MKGRWTAARRSEERKWSKDIDNIYDNSVGVRQHLRARAGAVRKAIEIREESQPPGRSRLQSNLCDLPRTGLNQISREDLYIELDSVHIKMSTPVYKRTQTNNRFATLSDNEHPGSPISEGLDQDAKQDDCNPKKRHGSAKFTINDMSGRSLCNVNLGFVEHANMVSMEELIAIPATCRKF